jgi:hypothetical protein
MQDSHGEFTCLHPPYDSPEEYADQFESEIALSKYLVPVNDVAAAMADLDSMRLTCAHPPPSGNAIFYAPTELPCVFVD